MKHEDHLLTGIFTEGTNLREESLRDSLAFMRKHARRRRAIRQTGSLVTLIVTAGLLLWRQQPKTISTSVPSQTPALAGSVTAPSEHATVPGTHIRLLTDEELLDLFPGRAVAILGTGNERQLVFLDEQRHRSTASAVN